MTELQTEEDSNEFTRRLEQALWIGLVIAFVVQRSTRVELAIEQAGQCTDAFRARFPTQSTKLDD